MKTEKTYFMHRVALFMLLLLVAFATTSCEFVISQAETDGELPEDPEDCTINPDLCATNPNDPDNPDFTLPGIQLSNGLSFDAPFEIDTNQVTLRWSAVDDGGNPISFNYTFSFRYASPNENIENIDFIEIGTDKSISLSGLNETFNNELYSFEIKASYADKPEIKAIYSGQFTVNAFRDRGFLFSPYSLQSNADGTYTAEIYLDEVAASDDVTAFSLVVSYNSAYFNLTEDDITVHSEPNGFLGRDNAEVIFFTKITPQTVVLDIGFAGANLTPLSGGGAVCDIIFTPTEAFWGQASFEISSESVLKNSNGDDVEILGFGTAEISP